MGSRKIVFLARMVAHWPCKTHIKHPSRVNFSVTLLILMPGWIMWFWSWVRIAMLMRMRLRKCKHIRSIFASAKNVDCCDWYTWCINVHLWRCGNRIAAGLHGTNFYRWQLCLQGLLAKAWKSTTFTHEVKCYGYFSYKFYATMDCLSRIQTCRCWSFGFIGT